MPADRINYTSGPVMKPGGAPLVPPPGYQFGLWVGDTPFPDPNDPEFNLEDLALAIPIPGAGGTQATVYPVALAPGAAGNFTIAHGAPTAPTFVLIVMSSGGAAWLQSPTGFDATNLYLTAGDAGITGTAYVWTSVADQVIPFTTSAPGNFQLAHTIGATPALVLVEMDGAGSVWDQSPDADASNVYLAASDTGIKGRVVIWKNFPIIVVRSYKEIALAPGAAGNFQLAHGLGKTPVAMIIRMTSAGAIWEQSPTPYDATDIYLVASDAGITGVAEVWS